MIIVEYGNPRTLKSQKIAFKNAVQDYLKRLNNGNLSLEVFQAKFEEVIGMRSEAKQAWEKWQAQQPKPSPRVL
jgi:hypothetical protein